MPVSPWREALSGFDILAISLTVGIIATMLWLMPSTGAAEASRIDIRHRLRRLLSAALALLTLTTIAVLIVRSIAISGRTLTGIGPILPLVLMRTDFGHVWFARAGAVLLLWFAWSRLKADARQPVIYWTLLVLAALVALTRSTTGHAGDHGDFRIPVWIDWLHLLAAGLWGGVIIAFVIAVRPVLRRDPDSASCAFIVRRFSSIAAIGLALVVASGIYNAWHVLGAWRPLWTSDYGRILDIKLGLVILMALLGASNRFRHVPRLLRREVDGDAPPDAFRLLAATAAAEALLMLAILAVVALLMNSMPPASMF